MQQKATWFWLYKCIEASGSSMQVNLKMLTVIWFYRNWKLSVLWSSSNLWQKYYDKTNMDIHIYEIDMHNLTIFIMTILRTN